MSEVQGCHCTLEEGPITADVNAEKENCTLKPAMLVLYVKCYRRAARLTHRLRALSFPKHPKKCSEVQLSGWDTHAGIVSMSAQGPEERGNFLRARRGKLRQD